MKKGRKRRLKQQGVKEWCCSHSQRYNTRADHQHTAGAGSWSTNVVPLIPAGLGKRTKDMSLDMSLHGSSVKARGPKGVTEEVCPSKFFRC